MPPQRSSWTNLGVALALVTLALPLGRHAATPALAQVPSSSSSTAPGTCTPSTLTNISADCYADVGPTAGFDLIGVPKTFTFVCDALTGRLHGSGGSTLAPGCYNVRASVLDMTAGSSAPINSGTCGPVVAAVFSGLDCSGYASPICPVGTLPSSGYTPASPCTAYAAATGVLAANTATVTVNPGAPHHYAAIFTGYIPTTATGSCPDGTALVPNAQLTLSTGIPPLSSSLGSMAACFFSVSANEYYFEITRVSLKTQPVASVGTVCGGLILPFPSGALGPGLQAGRDASGHGHPQAGCGLHHRAGKRQPSSCTLPRMVDLLLHQRGVGCLQYPHERSSRLLPQRSGKLQHAAHPAGRRPLSAPGVVPGRPRRQCRANQLGCCRHRLSDRSRHGLCDRLFWRVV